MLHDIWKAGTKDAAGQAFDLFVTTFEAKYEKSVKCLKKDRDVLLTFFDFPAENWCHIRTTNPIESTFATIRLRHRKTNGNGSAKASLTMMFKPAQSASKGWRKLRGHPLDAPMTSVCVAERFAARRALGWTCRHFCGLEHLLQTMSDCCLRGSMPVVTETTSCEDADPVKRLTDTTLRSPGSEAQPATDAGKEIFGARCQSLANAKVDDQIVSDQNVDANVYIMLCEGILKAIGK